MQSHLEKAKERISELSKYNILYMKLIEEMGGEVKSDAELRRQTMQHEAKMALLSHKILNEATEDYCDKCGQSGINNTAVVSMD